MRIVPIVVTKALQQAVRIMHGNRAILPEQQEAELDRVMQQYPRPIGLSEHEVKALLNSVLERIKSAEGSDEWRLFDGNVPPGNAQDVGKSVNPPGEPRVARAIQGYLETRPWCRFPKLSPGGEQEDKSPG